ncbi:MAG TPA: dephospho-CoA kinase [Acidimicrobiales bacterium]|nr:dephospho-CoA kinase [Acidimicrobiales bacterium]
MLSVGLTGKIGSGKSTVARALRARGADVIDTDAVARKVLSPGAEPTREVLALFGEAVRAPDGSLDRAALSRLVFTSPDLRKGLEDITHPRIRQEVALLRRCAQSPVVVVEIPLLDKRRASEYGFDAVVLVDVPTQVAVARAVSRGMAEADILARLAAQPTDDERYAIADRVLDNSGSLLELEHAIDSLWTWLSEHAAVPGARPQTERG